MTTREQIIAAGFEHFEQFPDDYKQKLVALFEAGRQAEREECFSLKKDALEIFNFNQQETSQEVRDVIEWFSGAIRARGNSK